MGHADTLIAMGGAFVAAAVLARLGARIGLPTIPLFILAGILLGSHTPGFVLLDDVEDLEMLAALGLVLLLFYLGLEFHLDDLRAGGRRMAVAGAMYLVLNVGAGLAFGLALGWGTAEAFVLAGVLGISSSAIVTKLLVDLRRIGNPETTPILGIIVVEDLFLAMYLAALQPVITGGGDAGETALQIGRAFVFLLALAVAARWGVRLIGRLFRLGDDELLVISFLGAAVLVAGIAELFGVADAIGAFMVGLILGSTDSGERIRKLVHPLRDAFAAIFFFTFGLSIDPRDLPSVLVPVLLAVLVTLTMNVSAGLFTSRLYGFGRLRTANVATTLLARGEFALILATMAAQAGLDERLSPFIAGYVLILAIVAPLVAGRSHWLARVLPRSGPAPDAASAHRAPPGVAEDAAPPVRPSGPAERTDQGGPGDPADPAAVPGTGAPGPYAPDPYAPVADATAHSPPPPDGPEPDPHADGHRPHHFPETEYTAPRLPAPDGHHPHSPDRDADHLHTPDRDRDPDGRPNPDHRHPDRDRERAPNPDHDHGRRLDLDPDHT